MYLLELRIQNQQTALRYLDVVSCFFTDRPVDYEILVKFTERHTAVFAPLEHARWVREHKAMGWRQGEQYLTLPLEQDDPQARKALREQMRQHALCLDKWKDEKEIFRHYERLPFKDQGKDWKPFNSMLVLLKKFEGVRIYKL